VVTPIIEKIVDIWLKWFRHVEKRLVDYVVKRVDEIEGSQITRGR
jgi:hypothetical protein